MKYQFRTPTRLLPLLAAVLYLLGAAADPLLHAHVGDEAHAHAGHSLCPTEEDAPAEGHHTALCALCRLSATAAEAPEPHTLRAGPDAEIPPPARPRPAPTPLAHLAPAPRGPPHG